MNTISMPPTLVINWINTPPSESSRSPEQNAVQPSAETANPDEKRAFNALHLKPERERWTYHQTIDLLYAVDVFANKRIKWEMISKMVGDKTSAQCLNRLQHLKRSPELLAMYRKIMVKQYNYYPKTASRLEESTNKLQQMSIHFILNPDNQSITYEG